MSYGKLSMLHGAALYSGAVLGTGVLVLPSLAMDVAGPASVLAWALLIILSIPLATTFAVLGSRFPDSGGVSSFARRAFGRFAGGITGWIFYGGVMLGTPSAAMMGGLYIARPFHAGNTTAVLIAVVLYAVAVGVIAKGIRASSSVQLTMAALLITTLLFVIAAAVPSFDPDNMLPFAPNGVLAIGQAASLLMFAFVGWEAVSPMTADFKRPEKDVPRATTVALIVTSTLYLALAVALSMTQPTGWREGAASLVGLLSLSLGNSARWIMAVIAGLLTMGALLAYVGGGAKQGASLAAQGFLVRAFRGGALPGQTPLPSLAFVTTIAMAVFLLMARFPGTLRFAIHASSACFTAVYVLGAAAGIRLLRKEAKWACVSAIALLLACIPLLFSGVFLVFPLGFCLFGAMMERFCRADCGSGDSRARRQNCMTDRLT